MRCITEVWDSTSIGSITQIFGAKHKIHYRYKSSLKATGKGASHWNYSFVPVHQY